MKWGYLNFVRLFGVFAGLVAGLNTKKAREWGRKLKEKHGRKKSVW